MKNTRKPSAVGQTKRLPYMPGTGKTIPIPNHVPGTGTTRTLPYRPRAQATVRDDIQNAIDASNRQRMDVLGPGVVAQVGAARKRKR